MQNRLSRDGSDLVIFTLLLCISSSSLIFLITTSSLLFTMAEAQIVFDDEGVEDEVLPYSNNYNKWNYYKGGRSGGGLTPGQVQVQGQGQSQGQNNKNVNKEASSSTSSSLNDSDDFYQDLLKEKEDDDYYDELFYGHREARDPDKEERQQGCLCIRHLKDPHCGSDNKVYDNGCYFECAQKRNPRLYLRKWGPCE